MPGKTETTQILHGETHDLVDPGVVTTSPKPMTTDAIEFVHGSAFACPGGRLLGSACEVIFRKLKDERHGLNSQRTRRFAERSSFDTPRPAAYGPTQQFP